MPLPQRRVTILISFFSVRVLFVGDDSWVEGGRAITLITLHGRRRGGGGKLAVGPGRARVRQRRRRAAGSGRCAWGGLRRGVDGCRGAGGRGRGRGWRP